ncbi:MAG TPA: 16S rRNA (guanine(966)-N(2))-methyltransferase RsmD [Acidimicrobiales bacterium]|nr:16S rRNA (guanine(966)-N(2))-methyltransferase RsmD [Acidimicrobiales bacterium]
MRVIAGTLRGRRLRPPPGTTTRPTADRVREAIFDVLGSMLDLDGLAVLDLFAGSGAMGIEALSRGAASAVFVERDPAAVAVIRANLDSLGVADRATVVRGDAVSWLAGGLHRADLALCDPPYRFEEWAAVLTHLSTPIAVLESSRPVEVEPPWEVVKDKRYGGTLVTVVRWPDRP